VTTVLSCAVLSGFTAVLLFYFPLGGCSAIFSSSAVLGSAGSIVLPGPSCYLAWEASLCCFVRPVCVLLEVFLVCCLCPLFSGFWWFNGGGIPHIYGT